MSTLIIKPFIISEITPHNNADNLEIIKVEGWQVVAQKNAYKIGDQAIYIPPDSMVPKELADKWGVTKYLKFYNWSPKGRVRATKIRNEVSFGFLAPNELNLPLDENVAEILQIEKFEPPDEDVNISGQLSKENPYFFRYTNIENLRNFKNIFSDQDLIVTEKIHGCNMRIGTIDGKICVGSHRKQLKEDEDNVFWKMYFKYKENIDKFFEQITLDFPNSKSIILYGEVFGYKAQDLKYGLISQDFGAFDISVNGKYLDYLDLESYCKQFKIPMPPKVGFGKYSFEELLALAEGKSLICSEQIKEGVVVRTMKEQFVRGIQRAVFKLINSEYYLRKKGTEYH